MWTARAAAAVKAGNRCALPKMTKMAIRTFSSSISSSRSFWNPSAVISHRFSLRLFSSSNHDLGRGVGQLDESDEEEENEGWEEEGEEVDPRIGDGGDGGGIVLKDVAWGEQTLSIARDVLSQFGEDIALHAFKVSPKGYIYVRLDKLTNEDFRHEKTKKKRGTYRVGQIDLQSRSIKVNYSDEE